MAPFEVRYSRPFYLSMLVIGMVCSVAAVKFALDPPSASGQAAPHSSVLWFVVGAVVLTMGAYMLRAMKRLTSPLPAVVVRDEGIVLNIGRPRLFRWPEIESVSLGRFHMRNRLEITVSHDRFDELNLPRQFADDNFMAVRQKPDTIGLTGQGLDHTLLDIMEAVRARRANLVRR